MSVNVLEDAGNTEVCVALLKAKNIDRQFSVYINTESRTAIGKLLKKCFKYITLYF